MQETTRSEIPGATHMIFREDGRLIAHPSLLKEIIDAKGSLSMQSCGDRSLLSLYRAVSGRRERQFSDYDEGSESYYCVARLSGPEWFYVTTMPRHLLQAQAFQSAQWVLWSGLLSIALVIAFLATILRRQIAQPLQELTRATKQMSGGDHSARAGVRQQNELGVLAGSFNEMAGRVAARESDLRQLNQDLEQRVEQRTSELTEANRLLDEGREEALRLLARERELSELKSDFVSLVSHEFRTPLEIIISSSDNLQRYHDRLPPEKREHLLRTINKSVKRMSGMMEEVLVLGRLETDRMTFSSAPLEFRHFCQRVCDEIEAATGKRCRIALQMNGTPEEACGDESLLRHIFTNLLSNAVKYSPPDQRVDFVVEQDGDQAVCRITDRGCGIPEGDRKRLFQAFHRGSNVRQIPGTGLGLLIVQRCVDLHGGEICYESVEGQGTTFTVQLPLFAAGSLQS
jgi:signal transduction histidine kinase